MPTTCEIIFENSPELVYYGGQLLSGRVEVTLTSSKTLRGTICFKFLFVFFNLVCTFDCGNYDAFC